MKKYISAAIRNFSDMPAYELVQYVKNPLASTRELQQIYDYAMSCEEMPRNVRHTLTWRLLANPNTPRDILYKYLKPEYWGALAENPSIPEDIAREIASSGTLNVLTSLAANPSIPVDLIERFLNAHDFDLIAAAAANSNCPIELRKKFEEEYNVEVAYSIYLSAVTPESDDFDYFLDDVAACIRNTITRAGYEYRGWDEDLPDTLGESGCFTAYSSWVPNRKQRIDLADKIQEDLETAGHLVSDIDIEVDYHRE